MDRKELLDRASSPEDRVFIARMLDKIQLAGNKSETVVTDFCDPYQQGMISPVLFKVPGISFIWQGGYQMAERQRLVICPDFLDSSEADAEITAISVTGNFKFQKLTHRDYLGSILGLGIKREKIGDLLVTERGCQLVVDREIADYITRNLTKVHRLTVKVEPISIDELEIPEEKVREVFATVSSLRLDAVAAVGFGVSRSKIAGEIAADKVRVNWNTVSEGSYTLKVGDRISARTRGRIEVHEIKGETKKGRISVLIKRYQ